MTVESDKSRPGSGLPFLESMNGRTICRMRLILALSALVIIYIDPSEPNRLVPVTYGALLLYSLYSAVLYVVASRHHGQPVPRAHHWLDVAWCLLLVSLSSGTGSIFFFFFFFAVLVASFLYGFLEGLSVTIVSAVLFTAAGLLSAGPGQVFELNRFLLRPIYLVVLGYMIAYWGGFEIQLKRRLSLLKEVRAFSNPRFGIGHTVATLMKRVGAFYHTEACLLILKRLSTDEYTLTRVGPDDAGKEAHAELIPPEVASRFLALPENVAALYSGERRAWEVHEGGYYAYDLAGEAETEAGREESERLAVLLEAESFISVPLVYREQNVGRVYLTGRRGTFKKFDIGFLNQIVGHVMPVIDNIRLLDRLASGAAEQERQKIARDIHDSVIQPYIGLQYKVAAIRNKLMAGDAEVEADLEHLFAVTVEEITGLRSYVRGLKDSGAARRDDLLSAVRRYTAQFQEHYGISVEVESRNGVNVNDRLAAELIQIVHEGLSNVRKHTQARASRISLENCDKNIILAIENDNASPENESVAPFVPRSITERAETLGGRVRVKRRSDGTSVIVEIPL
ncbi:MAG TPA: histidine kinase [Pyrinomonadaceae bacterium]|nr:histidine kinase [Pyrinomonadaceae bacterium]